MQRASNSFSVRILTADTVSAADASAWAALETRALEPNAYLSPHFVLPAVRHLDPQVPVRIFLVERHRAATIDLVGVAVLRPVDASLRFPARRLAGYRSRHSYLSGLLLDRDCAAGALAALLHYLHTQLAEFKLLELPLVRADGPLAAPGGLAEQTAAFGVHRTTPLLRSYLPVAEAPAQLQLKPLANKMRDLARRSRRLRERGVLEWHLHRADGIPAAVIDAFLALEHQGWKSSEGSSLRSQPADEAFFCEVVAGFAAERRAILAELVLDGTPIASSCNFVSGNLGFAFKIGWNVQLRAYSPGWLNEVEFMRNAPAYFGDLLYLDSGAAPDSFINELWPGRYPLCTLLIPTTAAGAAVLAARDGARRLRQRLHALVARHST